MTKTLTYLVFLLTMFVSVSSFAEFTSNGTGYRNSYMNSGQCAETYAEACSLGGGYIVSSGSTTYCKRGTTSLSHTTCTLPVPTNSTCSGSGSTRTCSCNAGFNEVTSVKQCVSSCASVGGFSENVNGVQTCVSACSAGNIPVETTSGPLCSPSEPYETDCTGDGKYLNKNSSGVYSCSTAETGLGVHLAAIIGFVSAGVLAGLACTIASAGACAGALAVVLSGAGLMIADNLGIFTSTPETQAAAQNASPNGQPLTVQLAEKNDAVVGIHRDNQGNLTPTGTGWTQNGDNFTRTDTDGTKTSTTTVNTANDTAVHTITNSATGQTSTTSIAGGGSDSGGGGAIISSANTSNNVTTAAEVKTNQSGVTDLVTVTCQGSTCSNPNNTTGGGDTGGGDTGGGDTGGGDTGGGSSGSVDCPECEILTNILNTLKGQGTDGATLLQDAQIGLEQGLNTAKNQLDQGFNSILEGLPIHDALEDLGLNPLSQFSQDPACSLPVSILGVNSQISYCEWQEQIHAGVAFFAFLMFLFSVREIVFERPQ